MSRMDGSTRMVVVNDTQRCVCVRCMTSSGEVVVEQKVGPHTAQNHMQMTIHMHAHTIPPIPPTHTPSPPKLPC